MNLNLNHTSSVGWNSLHSTQTTALDIQKFSSLAVLSVDQANIISLEKYNDDGN
jgi:hypothetical protein